MRIKKAVENLVAAVSPTDVAAIERELAKLEQRRAQLAESLDAATHNAINASTVRRELIIANRDQQALDEASVKVRGAEERRVGLDDALRALEEKIATTTARLEEAKDKAKRDRVAQALEQEAESIEKAISAIEKLAKPIGAGFRQLEAALSPASTLRTPEQTLNHSQIAGMLTAEALAANAAGLFVNEHDELGVGSALRRAFPIGERMVKHATWDKDELEKPVGARSLAERLITRPLRAKAAAIRSGEEPAVLPSAPPAPAQENGLAVSLIATPDVSCGRGPRHCCRR